MKVAFRLIGKGEPGSVVFTLEGAGGKDPEDQRTAWEHFRQHCNVQGLHFQLSGSGLIILDADQSQLRPDVVNDIRRHAQNALDQI
jgi:hypothetical protein